MDPICYEVYEYGQRDPVDLIMNDDLLMEHYLGWPWPLMIHEPYEMSSTDFRIMAVFDGT